MYNQEKKEKTEMGENRRYDHEYKVQAVKLAKEIGQAKAARELGDTQEYAVRLDKSQTARQARFGSRYTDAGKCDDAQ